MRVYIAGAMTGVFKYKEKFIEAEEYIRGLGHIVLNPSFLPEGLSDYYEINKAMIMKTLRVQRKRLSMQRAQVSE